MENQQQQAEIQQLRAENQQLQAEVEQLEAQSQMDGDAVRAADIVIVASTIIWPPDKAEAAGGGIFRPRDGSVYFALIR